MDTGVDLLERRKISSTLSIDPLPHDGQASWGVFYYRSDHHDGKQETSRKASNKICIYQLTLLSQDKDLSNPF